MRRSWLSILAATFLIGCGNVKGMTAADAAPTTADAAATDAASNPCAPDACLLFDDFNGASLNASLWGIMVGGGATVTQAGGVLSIRLPAAADAFADVYSLVAFPAGTALETSVAVTAGQFYNHTGVGFASAAIGNQCDVGETDAAMFRGQDQDGYVETKASGVYSCNRTTPMYPAGPSRMRIARAADQVEFRQNDIMLAALVTNLPAGHLPVRFTAYTYTIAPTQPFQIDIDYVFVKHL
jgi:hypothetical protein